MKFLTKRICAFFTAGCLATGLFSVPISANETYDSPLYPTPESVSLLAADYNPAAPDWSEFDKLMEDADSFIPADEREMKMHQAEDLLMESAAIIPLLYSVRTWLQKENVEGIYNAPNSMPYLAYAEIPGTKLRANFGAEPATLDPGLLQSSESTWTINQLFCGLYQYDESGQLIPDLADEDNPVDITEDGTCYTFHLKKGLKWSDGSPLTAEDFVYSWKRVADPSTGAPYSYIPEELISQDGDEINVKAIDTDTIQLRLKAPCSYFLTLMAFPVFYPVNRSAVEAADIYGNNPGAWVAEAGFVTNGPYVLDTWHYDEAMILKKNPNYHKAELVGPDEIDLMLSADSVAAYAAYSADNLDYLCMIPTNEVSAIKNRPDFHRMDLAGTYLLAFNVNSNFFYGKTVEQAVNMRKAFSLLIDRDFLNEDIIGKGQTLANAMVSPCLPDNHDGFFKTNTELYRYPYAEETGYFPVEQTDEGTSEAIKLLESAGYKFENGKLSDTTPMHLILNAPSTDQNRSVCEEIQQDLAEIGIDLEIYLDDPATYYADVSSGHFTVAVCGWSADYDDPSDMLEIYESNSLNNFCRLGYNE